MSGETRGMLTLAGAGTSFVKAGEQAGQESNRKFCESCLAISYLKILHYTVHSVTFIRDTL